MKKIFHLNIICVCLLCILQMNCVFDKSGLPCMYAITSDPPPDGCSGMEYNYTLDANFCGTPYTWSISGGSLPDGITFDTTTGVLSGTPTLNGTFTFIVEVQGGGENSLEQYTIRIGGLRITTAGELPDFCPGDLYNVQLEICGGSGNMTWEFADRGNLPNSISITNTGRIEGNIGINDGGPFTFTVRVTDGDTQETDEKEFTLEPAGNLFLISPYTLPSGAVDANYNYEFLTCGGTPPYTSTITEGSLPPGISVVPNSKTIAGTPCPVGAYSFKIQITDSSTPQTTAVRQFFLDINPSELRITTPGSNQLPDVIECQPGYALQFDAAGGSGSCSGNYEWRAPGGLPPGLELELTTGAMSGSPSVPAPTPYSFSIEVTDTGINQQTSETYTLTVLENLQTDPELVFDQVRHDIAGRINLSYFDDRVKADFHFDPQAAPALYNDVQNGDRSMVTEATIQVVGNCATISTLAFVGPANRNGDSHLDITARIDQYGVVGLLNSANISAGDTVTLRLEVTVNLDGQFTTYTGRLTGVNIVQ